MNKNIPHDVLVNMYPDIYKRVLPFVDEAIEVFGGGHQMDDRALNSMTNHVLARADFHGRPHRGYSERAIRDIIRALVISRIISGCGRGCGRHGCRNRCDFAFPFFPFWWGSGGGCNRGGRGGGGFRRGGGRRRR